MMKDWIRNYGFLEDITSKKGKVPTLFKDGTRIQEKSSWRVLIFFENLGLEIQGKNSPKRAYLVDIQMGYVPCRGSAVSHVKPLSIMLLIKEEIV